MRVQLILTKDAVELRRQVLRPEAQSDDAVIYEEDLAATSATYGCFVEGALVSVGTVMEAPHPKTPRVGDWRIRGMATDEQFRSRGCGELILGELLEHARKSGGQQVWCNARIDAVPFYARAGFRRRGRMFLTAGDRPHYLMDLGELSSNADWRLRGG